MAADTMYAVVLSETDDDGARWIYVRAESPQAAAPAAIRRAAEHGYGIGSTHVEVYQGRVEGSTIGETPLWQGVTQ